MIPKNIKAMAREIIADNNMSKQEKIIKIRSISPLLFTFETIEILMGIPRRSASYHYNKKIKKIKHNNDELCQQHKTIQIK